MQSRSHRRGGPFCGKEPHPQRPTLLHTLLQQTHRRYLTSNPLPSHSSHSWQERIRGGPQKNVATGTKCGVLGGASPPPEPADLRRADRRGRSRKQVANRRLHTSGSSSLGLPELKKEFTPPASSIHHWDFGLTRVWFNALRPVLSSSMACWIKFELIFNIFIFYRCPTPHSTGMTTMHIQLMFYLKPRCLIIRHFTQWLILRHCGLF